jgi:hypothetical protein
VVVEIGEFEKAEAGLTCLSLLVSGGGQFESASYLS